ncbi:MAG: hypothetical protein KC457_26995 [Myxococcales bacterium]|nr:hypothetical protein [Myxococcales bacterium]
MRYRLREVTFELPPELDAPAVQHYWADDATFTVERGDDGEPAEVVAELRRRLELSFPSASLTEPAEIALRGRPGQRYAFAITDDGGRAGAQALIGPDEGDEPGTVVRLGWQGKADLPAADAFLDAVVASVREPDTGEAPEPGRRRWWMGGLAFSLPQEYDSATVLELEGFDEQVQLRVSLHPFDSKSIALDERAAAELAEGHALTAREDVPIIHGDWLRLRLAGPGATEATRFVSISVQRREVGNPVRIRQIEVRLAGPADLARELQGMHERLLASLIVENSR